jgi:hypothetical protein
MDHVADVNLTTFHQISQLHKLPDFVKSAAIDRDAIAQLPPTAFADPAHRQFPCHTRADTFLSYAYFLKNASQLDGSTRRVAWENLRKFAHHWAIFMECEKLQRAHEKQASSDLDAMPNGKFAIVEEYNDETYRALPLLNGDCVKAAAEHLAEFKDRYPLSWRQAAAERVLSAATEFGVEPPHLGYLHKAARRNTSSSTDIARGMLDRALLINKEHRGEDEQVKFAQAARVMADAHGDVLLSEKAALLIDQFDEHYNLRRYYARGLPAPEEICFSSVTAKEASDLRDTLITMANGEIFSKAALEQAGLTPYRALGDDFVKEISDGLSGVSIDKIASLVPTLPRDDADILGRALKAAGVRSVVQLQKEAKIPEHVCDWTREDWDHMVAAVTT